MDDDDVRMLWDRTEQDERHDALLADGWQPWATKAFVERDLSSGVPSVDLPTGWRLHTLAELGETEFAARVQRTSVGDPFEETTPEGAVTALQELVEMAGDAFDATGWYAVDDNRGEVGVVLPQPYDDVPHMGTLFYVGVVPVRRGGGAGTLLHAFGQAELAGRGVRRYVGSTDERNPAMLAVLERNGARRIRTQSFYRRG